MSYSATMVRVSREYVHVVSSSLVKSFRLIVLTIVQAPALFQVNKHSRIAGGFLHYTQPHKDRKANFGWEWERLDFPEYEHGVNRQGKITECRVR